MSRPLDLWHGLPITVVPQGYILGLFKKRLRYGLQCRQHGCNALGSAPVHRCENHVPSVGPFACLLPFSIKNSNDIIYNIDFKLSISKLLTSDCDSACVLSSITCDIKIHSYWVFIHVQFYANRSDIFINFMASK